MPGPKTNEREGTRSVLRHARVSPYKVREVLDLVRNKPVAEAADILRFTERDAGILVAKVLHSAVANAQHNDSQDPEELFVSACYADEGSTLKRWRPRARGRATRIRKRTSHITIIVSRLPDDRIARRRAKQAASGSQRSRRVAGSRRRQQAETRGSGTQLEDESLDTGSEAWPEDAVQADDVITETEAGPLEESDLDPEAEVDADEEGIDETDATDEAEGIDETEATDELENTGTDTDDTEDEADGGSAEEKGK